MSLEGTVVNGVIVLDAGPPLPEGARVRVELAEEDPDDVGPPPEPYDREKELAILRESLEDAKAGRGVPAREFLKQLAIEHNLPLEPGE
ncbi:MAG: hypothetical protein JWO38_1475 [Gemmataceae bacterium]|nr:hypothetical protein [Gemmataceae bacterium]